MNTISKVIFKKICRKFFLDVTANKLNSNLKCFPNYERTNKSVRAIFQVNAFQKKNLKYFLLTLVNPRSPLCHCSAQCLDLTLMEHCTLYTHPIHCDSPSQCRTSLVYLLEPFPSALVAAGVCWSPSQQLSSG